MNPRDITKLLESFTFTDLALTKTEGNNYTFKFASYNHTQLEKALGKPTVAAGNKVAVFQIPGVGKIGVSPANSMVRIVVTATSNKTEVDDSHLGQQATTPELSMAFKRAQANPRFRLAFTKELWKHFNHTKFNARMAMPKIEVGTVPSFGFPRGGLKSARGVHQGGNNYTPGIIFIADFLFNGREAFFNEILLHEMCITGDSLISTELGDIRIDALANSGATSALSRCGLTKISKVWESKPKPTLKLTTITGCSLRLTDDHPVLVRKWWGYKWVPAGRLKPGDKLLTKIPDCLQEQF